jgi:5-methylcytosine-specific restriction endonuclease McrA
MLKGEVLLLNKSYEVLRVVPVRRAICMMLRDDNPAREVEASGKFLHTSSGKRLSVPSVIALSEYRDIRNRIRASNAKRLKVLVRDGFRCVYCGRKPANASTTLTLDHVIPKSRGGQNTPENLVAACKPCNNRKDNRTPAEAGMALLKKPKAMDTGFDRVMNKHYLQRHPEWSPYLFDNNEGDSRFQVKGE